LRIDCFHKSQAGFTLVEIMVAFAILGLVAGAVLSVFSSGPGRIAYADNERMAVVAVKSLLDELGTERVIEAGEWQGDLQTGGHWKLAIEPYDDAKRDPDRQRVVTPYLVRAHATAGTAWNAARVDIETVRLKVGGP